MVPAPSSQLTRTEGLAGGSTPALSDEELRPKLNEFAGHWLRPLAKAVYFLYITFAVIIHPLTLSGRPLVVMSALSGSLAIVFFSISRRLAKHPVPAQSVHWVLFAYAMLALADAVVNALLVSNPVQSFDFILILMAIAMVGLSMRTFAALAALFLAAWAICVPLRLPLPVWQPYVGVMLIGTVFSILIQVVRISIYRRIIMLQKEEADGRHRLEALLNSTRAQLQLLADNASDLVFLYQPLPVRSFRYINPAVYAITGYPPEAFYADPQIVERIVYPDDLGDAQRAWPDPRCLDLASDTDRVVHLHHRDGRTIFLEIRLSPRRDASGNVIAIEGIGRDVTERIKAQHELAEAKDRAEALSRLRAAVIMNLSHEIRTPVSVILANAELAEPKAPEFIAKRLRLIHSAGVRLLLTVSNIVDFAQMESGSLELHPVAHSAAASVRNAIGQVQSLATQKGITLESSLSDVKTLTDPYAEQQIMLNLLHNSVKFSNHGKVTVGLTADKDGAEFRIADTGQGIDEQFKPHVFEEFRQGSEGTAREFEGMGLGLTVAKRFVESAGGHLRITSRQGLGTEVVVNLPAA